MLFLNANLMEYYRSWITIFTQGLTVITTLVIQRLWCSHNNANILKDNIQYICCSNMWRSHHENLVDVTVMFCFVCLTKSGGKEESVNVSVFVSQVEILAGKDKGKQGKVIQVFRHRNWVILEGLNTVRKWYFSKRKLDGDVKFSL